MKDGSGSQALLSFSYDPAGQLTAKDGTAFAYDGAGNLTWDGTWHYTYDRGYHLVGTEREDGNRGAINRVVG